MRGNVRALAADATHLQRALTRYAQHSLQWLVSRYVANGAVDSDGLARRSPVLTAGSLRITCFSSCV